MKEKVDMINEASTYYYNIIFVCYRCLCVKARQLLHSPAINTGNALAPIANHQAAKLSGSQRLRFQSMFRSDQLCVVTPPLSALVAGSSEKAMDGQDKPSHDSCQT
jgi:hypothetical protein